MTPKTYLSQARKIELKLKTMAAQLRSLRDAAENISPSINDMPRPSSPNNRHMEDAIVRMMEMEKAMCAEFNKLADIHKTIYIVSDSIRQATLVKRYIDGDDWASIAVDLGISIRRVYQIHGAALVDVGVIIESQQPLH